MTERMPNLSRSDLICSITCAPFQQRKASVCIQVEGQHHGSRASACLRAAENLAALSRVGSCLAKSAPLALTVEV